MNVIKEALPCPFCGHNDHLDEHLGRTICRFCGASAGSNVWNNRPAAEAVDGLVNLLAEIREDYHQAWEMALLTEKIGFDHPARTEGAVKAARIDAKIKRIDEALTAYREASGK